jgi:hypothetical protein
MDDEGTHWVKEGWKLRGKESSNIWLLVCLLCMASVPISLLIMIWGDFFTGLKIMATAILFGSVFTLAAVIADAKIAKEKAK